MSAIQTHVASAAERSMGDAVNWERRFPFAKGWIHIDLVSASVAQDAERVKGFLAQGKPELYEFGEIVIEGDRVRAAFRLVVDVARDALPPTGKPTFLEAREPFRKRAPLYERLGISRTGLYVCPFCRCQFFGHALSAHICRLTPDGMRRQVTEAEWRASLEAPVAKIGRAGL